MVFIIVIGVIPDKVDDVAKQTLTTGEIAQYCGVNFRTVIRWIKRGYLDAYQLPGRGDNRVKIIDFIDFLDRFNMPVPDDLKKEDGKDTSK